jgi:hypothetical protein
MIFFIEKLFKRGEGENQQPFIAKGKKSSTLQDEMWRCFSSRTLKMNVFLHKNTKEKTLINGPTI